MKSLNISTQVLALLLLLSTFSYAQNQYEDQVEAPYFRVENQSEPIKLPLVRTDVKVNITGVIADVRIQQVYVNNNDYPLDASYVFPGSTQSAVYKMKMMIQDRTIEAKITEKEEAKKKFEVAKNEGKGASLMEQHRPNVFEMSVANIPANDTIIVEFGYTELITPEEGIYEFILPTGVGPRYESPNDESKETWIQNPFTHKGNGANEEIQEKYDTDFLFNLDIHLNTGIPLNQVKCISHQIEAKYNSASEVQMNFPSGIIIKEPKDVIVQYELKGKEIQTGLILHEGKEENFFLYMAQPPVRPTLTEIPPREYIFIVDVSGSMHGFPIDYSKKLMSDLLGSLRPTDKFNVMLFAGTSALYAEKSVSATRSNIEDAFDFIDRQKGSGGTELLSALERALELPGIEDVSRTVVIATDGYVTVEREAFDLIRDNLGNANFFSFGIGPGVNRYIIEGMAHAGNGAPFIIPNEAAAKKMATRFAKYVQTPVLTNVEVEFEGFDVYDVEPSNFSDLFAEKPIVVFGKWKGPKAGSIALKGKNGKGAYLRKTEVKNANQQNESEALKYLWARKKIQLLSDYQSLENEDDDLKEEILGLGLKYNLLTKYTSFLGIDTHIQDISNKPIASKPSGNPGAVPEPHEWLLIILTILTAGYFIYQRHFKYNL
jgi:Ca-activated chloride channel family protein